VRCLWINDLSGSRSECLQVVPDGCVDIVWTGETLCIAGPDTRPILARMPCGAIVVGVRFHPGAASAWLGQPLGEIVNVRVPLAEFWGDDATRFLDRAAAGRSAKQLADDLEAFLALGCNERNGDVTSTTTIRDGVSFLPPYPLRATA
jgi:hypothetical protein